MLYKNIVSLKYIKLLIVEIKTLHYMRFIDSSMRNTKLYENHTKFQVKTQTNIDFP